MLSDLRRRIRTKLNDFSYERARRAFVPPPGELSLADIRKRYPSPNLQHLYFRWAFDHVVPEELKEHRHFYSQERRGFGEDEFHALWHALFKQYRPTKVLEIGVYRGQVISLWGLLARTLGLDLSIHAISPFSPSGDAVSVYADLDYYADVTSNLARFGVQNVALHKGYSTAPAMVAVIRSRRWDLIYIDGCHDYEVVVQDFAVCAEALAPGGLIVLDDSALYSGFTPHRRSFAGQPGPSRLAQELKPSEWREIIGAGHNRVFRRQ